MIRKAGTVVQNKKNWVVPQLKKVDIELITATFNHGAVHDTTSSHS
jgi:hypothetical protein